MTEPTKPGEGLGAQLLAFFEANPDEELTFEDAKVKFDTDSHNLSSTLSYLKARGLLDTQRTTLIRRQAPWTS